MNEYLITEDKYEDYVCMPEWDHLNLVQECREAKKGVSLCQ
jgi:hypothetical protein